MLKMYFVGIDIAKRFHESIVIDEHGEIIIKHFKFQNSPTNYWVWVIKPLLSDTLHELCRQHFYTVDMISDTKHKIIALLDQIFPEYEKLFRISLR